MFEKPVLCEMSCSAVLIRHVRGTVATFYICLLKEDISKREEEIIIWSSWLLKCSYVFLICYRTEKIKILLF